MQNNITFSMVKPEIIKAGNLGEIITQIEQNGFRIKALKLTQLSIEDAKKFYAIHQARPFYQDLCAYMASGPIVAMVLEKDDAVASFRKLIGATNPVEALPGTIRKRFGKSIEENAIHGSDADSNASIEAKFFFPDLY
ncbi:MAG: nucleoside-diphosphate kinase [Candidatus Amoebophilus sp. 36-38]|nr:MAG: nucleoside-diphosphate kinase [Candidatus Amoebophilus sp. 36-38]